MFDCKSREQEEEEEVEREDGVSHGALVDRCQRVHRRLNLFSQFCFPKGFPPELLLSRSEDPDCQGHRPAVTVVQYQHVCSVCTCFCYEIVFPKLRQNTAYCYIKDIKIDF